MCAYSIISDGCFFVGQEDLLHGNSSLVHTITYPVRWTSFVFGGVHCVFHLSQQVTSVFQSKLSGW